MTIPFSISVGNVLRLDRSPHCGVARPHMSRVFDRGKEKTSELRVWSVYECSSCGGLVTAWAYGSDAERRMAAYFPEGLPPVADSIPERPREYLRQAQESVGQASGAVMLCASAVDAMLKEKGLKKGSLYERINKAAGDHLITKEMAKWAHEVRLDANDERHVDEGAAMPTGEDAARCLSFALALAEVLYVIPARVTRGIEESAQGKTAEAPPTKPKRVADLPPS